MGMTLNGVMQIGVSGAQAQQAAIAATSHNIANTSTPGYSRQGVIDSGTKLANLFNSTSQQADQLRAGLDQPSCKRRRTSIRNSRKSPI